MLPDEDSAWTCGFDELLNVLGGYGFRRHDLEAQLRFVTPTTVPIEVLTELIDAAPAFKQDEPPVVASRIRELLEEHGR